MDTVGAQERMAVQGFLTINLTREGKPALLFIRPENIYFVTHEDGRIILWFLPTGAISTPITLTTTETPESLAGKLEAFDLANTPNAVALTSHMTSFLREEGVCL